MLTHPSGLFSENYISAPRTCWPLKFSHVLKIDPRLLTHTTNQVRVHPKNFKDEHLKFGLKFNVLTPITLAAVCVTRRNFIMGCSSWPGW